MVVDYETGTRMTTMSHYHIQDGDVEGDIEHRVKPAKYGIFSCRLLVRPASESYQESLPHPGWECGGGYRTPASESYQEFGGVWGEHRVKPAKYGIFSCRLLVRPASESYQESLPHPGWECGGGYRTPGKACKILNIQLPSFSETSKEHILNNDWERIGTANCLSGRWQSFKQYQGDAASFGQILSKMATNAIRSKMAQQRDTQKIDTANVGQIFSKMVQQRGTRNKMAHNYMGRQQH
ncbi:hypothetical protein J6590_100488 [Homalodisca vitripennis]|nr:hypothetical protein J6590_100488 [Homalodisca vitripennis]